uniref:Oxidoreductase, short chain dehydrogenase/reductase family protein n=1 Tax=Babesia bovis TaxID=5865 RepID=A7ANX9_BABBO|eukprot:XP_001611831.1 hypothetical protein [Babesia bovis T2Bo]
MAFHKHSKTNRVAPLTMACAYDPCYQAIFCMLSFILFKLYSLWNSGFDVSALEERTLIAQLAKSYDFPWLAWIVYLQTPLMVLLVFNYASKTIAQGTKVPQILINRTDMHRKVAIVTGGSSGVGKEVACQLLKWNCKVVITARDKTKGANAVEYLRKQANVDFKMIQFVEMDLNDPKSIKLAVEEILKTNASIDFLINNAGIATNVHLNAYKQEAMFATNFLGHFQLTKLLMPTLVRFKARVINVSSIAHYYYNPNKDTILRDAQVYYGRSKLFNLWHAQALQRRFDNVGNKNCGPVAFSCGPGIVATPLLERYSSIVLPKFISAIVNQFTKKPKEGANTILYLCASPLSDLVPGGYYYECQLGYVSKYAQNVAQQEALYKLADKMTLN